MKFLLVLFVVTTLLATGEALKCYQCSSVLPGCDNPFDKSAAAVEEVTCSSDELVCCKIPVEIDPISLIMRGCGESTSSCTSLYSRESGYSCTTDLCNGVSATGAALSMLMLLAVPLVFGNYY